MVRYPLLLVVAALVARVALTTGTTGMGLQIVDEQHYARLASNLVDGVGFAWGPNEPTSIRPPLYPAFVAALWILVGEKSPDTVRWTQGALSLLNVWLLYLVGKTWFDRRTAALAAAGLAFYPSLLFSGVLLLTETLFVTLLLLFVLCCAYLEERPTIRMALATGASLGAATLTRSVMWPFIFVLPMLAWFGIDDGWRRRVPVVVAIAVGFALVVGPWAARNTALQGTPTVVDTMGGLNLLMGNYEHTPEDRMWDAVSLTGDTAWSATLPLTAPDGRSWTEGTKEKWAQRQALAFMRDHPWTTVRRSFLKFADFWGLERDFVAGVQRGQYNPPAWLVVLGAASITMAYVVTAVLGVIGIVLAPPSLRAHVLLLVLVVFICGVHTVVFGHSRYHLPLIPILLLYGASAITSGRWRDVPSIRGAPLIATAMVLGLVLVWAREILVRDWDRIRQLVAG